jgi:hypothetical protein
MSDPVPNSLTQDVTCLFVLGRPVYIVSPCSMLAWKTQHLIEKLHGSESNPKYLGDWNALMAANKALFDDATILRTAAEVVHYGAQQRRHARCCRSTASRHQRLLENSFTTSSKSAQAPSYAIIPLVSSAAAIQMHL